MDGLTTEDIQRLQAPFEPSEHEVREKGKSSKGKTLWLTYLEEGPVIERLNEIDPNWSLEITRVVANDRYVATYGRLTIKGITREGVGTNSPNSKNAPVGEDEEKGAATDMIKRLARLFGIGLYLKNAPTIYTDAEGWQGKPDAMRQLTTWHNQQFGGKQSAKPTPVVREVVQHYGVTKPHITPIDAAPNGDEQNPGVNPFNGQPAQTGLLNADDDGTRKSDEIAKMCTEFYAWATKTHKQLSHDDLHEILDVKSAKDYFATHSQGDARTVVANFVKTAAELAKGA